MRNYWSCTKFADWLRGTSKPKAATSEGWYEWNKLAKSSHKFRYWLAEEGLDKIQSFLYYPFDKIYAAKYYINNRFITRTHCLTASSRDIKPGEWCDVGNRFLPCLFNELVEFVEVELAWWHLAWNREDRPKYKAPWYRFGWWNVRLWRSKKAGLDNLDWQRSLTWKAEECEEGSPNIGQPTYQAVRAQEIYDLYTWWTVTRPARPDPHDVSGWSDVCEKRRVKYGDIFMSEKTPEEKAETSAAFDSLRKIEEQYEQEDEEMMIRLIKVRRSLWT